MTTNAINGRPLIWIIIAGMMLTILPVIGLLGGGSAASYQDGHNLEIIRQDDAYLILYAASDNPLDLTGIEFLTVVAGTNHRYSPFDDFDDLALSNGFLAPRTCLVIEQVGSTAPFPSQCEQVHVVSKPDVDIFWFDITRHEARAISVLQQSIAIDVPCSAALPACQLTWNPLPTPTPLPPITPNFILPGYDNTGEIESYTVDQLTDQTGISQWQQNYDGSGVKIGVIDRHFGALSSLGFPVAVSENVGSGDQNLNQGVAVLEIVHNIAPQAEFFACQYDNFTSFQACVDWMIANEVDIVNHSASVPRSGSVSQQDWAGEVTRASQNHILWVDSASNYQDGMMQDDFYDRNIPNGRHEFRINNNEVLGFSGIPNVAGTVMLAWSDLPNRSANTLDLDLLITDIETGQVKAQSAQSQVGNPTDEPFEIVTFDMRDPFGVQILNSTGQAVERLPFVLYVEFAALELPNAAFTTPADSPFALTVGVGNQDFVAQYSLHGSISDRIVPDLVAPGNVMLADGTQFVGTSAASPLITGYAALVLQSDPTLSNQELREFIQINSTQDDPFTTGRDTTYGDGYLAIPAPTLITSTPSETPVLPTTDSNETPTGDFPVAIVAVERANLRSGPNVTHGRVGMAVQDDELPIEGQAQGWYRVSSASASGQAWIAGSIVEVHPADAEIPLISDFPNLPPTAYPQETNTFPSPPPTLPGRDVPGPVINTPTIRPRTPQSLTPVITASPNVFATQTAVQNRTRVYVGLTQSATFWTHTPSPTVTFTPSPTNTPTRIVSIIVPTATLTPTPTNTFTIAPIGPPTARVTNPAGANLRSGPGTNYPIVGSAVLDQTFTILGSTGSGDSAWFCIDNSPSGSVWISSIIVNVTGGAITGSCSIPPPPPPPDRDGDGVPDSMDACPDRGDEGNGIDASGCPIPPPLTISIAKIWHTDNTPPCQIGVRVDTNRPTQGNIYIDNNSGTTYPYPQEGTWSFPGEFTLTLGGDQDPYYNHNIWVTAEGVTAGLGTVRCDSP